jgi:hypothetical protein
MSRKVGAMTAVSLYRTLGRPVTGNSEGRTDETRKIETIDRDRQALDALYRALAAPCRAFSDHGRTERTATVETIDRDRHLLDF